MSAAAEVPRASVQQLEDIARNRLLESARTKERLASTGLAEIVRAGELIARAFGAGGRLFLCGNGGSAGDSQHIATELVIRLSSKFERGPLPALALTTDSSLLTACANDYGFDHIFSRQVAALARRGDVLLAITTSGKSPNILRALEQARELEVGTILLSANEGGPCKALADVAILVPAEDTSHIQEAHIAVGHILCELVERLHCGRTGA